MQRRDKLALLLAGVRLLRADRVSTACGALQLWACAHRLQRLSRLRLAELELRASRVCAPSQCVAIVSPLRLESWLAPRLAHFDVLGPVPGPATQFRDSVAVVLRGLLRVVPLRLLA